MFRVILIAVLCTGLTACFPGTSSTFQGSPESPLSLPSASINAGEGGPTFPNDPSASQLATDEVVNPDYLVTKTFGFEEGECVCSDNPAPFEGRYLMTPVSYIIERYGEGIYPLPYRPAAEPTTLDIESCGETMILGGQIELEPEGGGYEGWGDGFVVNVTAESKRLGTLVITVPYSDHETRLTWRLDYRGEREEDDQGYEGYALITTRHLGVQKRGLYEDTYLRYDVVLFGFGVNDASLLPNHHAALDYVSEIVGDDGTPPPWTDTYVDTTQEKMAAAEIPRALDNFSEVVGRASQTGPEATNQRLSEARAANTWAELIHRNSRVADTLANKSQQFSGLGSSQPIIDAPGQEQACNRAAVFSFVMKYTSLDLPSRTEVEDWLRDDLSRACTPGQAASDAQINERLAAKGRFKMGLDFLNLVDQEGRILPGPDALSAPAYVFFVDPNSQYVTPRDRLAEAYRQASRQTTTAYLDSIDASPGEARLNSSARAAHVNRSENNPYYRYTYGSERTLNDDGEVIYQRPRTIRERALLVEQAECDTVTITQTSGFLEDFFSDIFYIGPREVDYSPDLLDTN